eukprot:m.129059 g.129059  ORF g.129059 m.129059 type:complete len:237 (+) comp37960_c0_seq32:320-1030(+)
MEIVHSWLPRLKAKQVRVVIGGHSGKEPKGGYLKSRSMDGSNGRISILVGFAKNRAIQQSSGQFLCFMDADDIMEDRRIEMQYETSVREPDALVGCNFCRIPPESTPRYTRWANSLTDLQLKTQAFTSFGPTIIQPSWFCSRDVFLKAGPFVEDGKGIPEDLLFFHNHLRLGGNLVKVDDCLLTYRYHPMAVSFSIKRWIQSSYILLSQGVKSSLCVCVTERLYGISRLMPCKSPC